ncbi:MAG: hypothetical protein R3194_04980, partial [Limnobacter sp.]|nr:hypothetical protein [Limnobacter sp.]
NPIDGSGTRFSLSRLWYTNNGYERFLTSLTYAMKETQIPTLLVHGDTHFHKWDQPDLSPLVKEFESSSSRFYRLEGWGHPNVTNYIRLQISPGHEKPFSIEDVSIN